MNFIFNLLKFLPAALGFIGRFLISVLLGISASLVWLWHYLKKDVIPEPKRAIFKVFVWGMIATFPVIIIEILASKLVKQEIHPFLYWFLIIAFTEEIFKYFVVILFKILNAKEVDEPVDIMIYMIVAALGFAGLENILYLLPTVEKALPFFETFKITLAGSLTRFLGATFLHTLSSGALGFFLALSFLKTKNRRRLLTLGFLIAIFFHGLFNLSLSNPELIYPHLGIEIEGAAGNIGYSIFLIPLIILITLFIFVSLAFKKLQKFKNACKI